VLFGTTIYNQGWFKSEVYDRWRAGDRDYEVIEFDSIQNPVFPREEYERARRTMPTWKFDMFYRGKFSKPAGIVYDCFLPTHIITRYNIPSNYHIYSGHDFGGINPAAVFLAQNPATGDFVAFQTYKPGEKVSTFEQVQKFKVYTNGLNVIKSVGGNHQEDGWRDSYTSKGWGILEPSLFMTHPKNAVETGIERVYEKIKLNRLFVFSDLHDLIDEIQSYSYKLNDNYEPIDEIDNKSSYHLLDALRYILSDFTPETVVKQNKPRVTGGW